MRPRLMLLRSGSAPARVELTIGTIEIAMQIAPLLIGQPAVACVTATAFRRRPEIALRLALEIDGPIHDDQRHYDLARDATLAAAGVLTIRLRADQVSTVSLEALVRATLRLRASPPLSACGEGDGG